MLLIQTLLVAGLAAPSGAQPAPPAPSSLQDEIVDRRPELKELLEELDDHMGARGEEDREAIAIIDLLVKTEWERSGPKDRKSILKTLGSAFKEKRKATPEGAPNNILYLASAKALGLMGPESAKEIMSWIDHKSHRSDLMVQRELILALGKTRDEKGADELMGQLLNKYPELVAAAAESLANYDTADEKLRKEIFKEINKILGAAKVNVDQDPNDTIARERYDLIEASMITTLQAMTRQKLRTPEDWTSWWNDNKKKDWDEDL